MDESIKLETLEGIALLTLNRPSSFNAFGREMIHRLAELLSEASMDHDIKGVVITGQGKAFCAGGDLRWLAGSGKRYGEAFHLLAASYHKAIVEIRRMQKPVVAAVNGLAAGGGFSMALACDFRVMEASALFKQGYTSNGLSIDGGGTFTLPRLVGLARAMEIAVFDRPISPEQALSWGLVTEVAAEGKSVERARAMIQEILRGASSSFLASKALLTDSFHTSLETQLEKERHFLAWCADHRNGKEGIAAFLEKRSPRYL
ncbi:MAG: enoyl-CoA hydratase/isomerase family protein [Deltaproteobacteria bacterium]|nr:enoyl-CoA hydratase/isomerase family protein [Deltaproteobacteria bacterium]